MKTTAKVELKDPLQNHFIHLFDLEFQGTPGMEPVVPEEEQDGDHIGSGEGVVTGDAISGKIKFSMFAENCALLLVRAGVEPAPGPVWPPFEIAYLPGPTARIRENTQFEKKNRPRSAGFWREIRRGRKKGRAKRNCGSGHMRLHQPCPAH